jgi:hypothetical protein
VHRLLLCVGANTGPDDAVAHCQWVLPAHPRPAAVLTEVRLHLSASKKFARINQNVIHYAL